MPKVLLVEDDRYINKLISDRLSLEGFEVESVLDGESAWTSLNRANEHDMPFDFLLTDMLLPKLMGAELLNRVRDNRDLDALRIIAVSGIYKDPTQITELSRLYRVERYFTKP